MMSIADQFKRQVVIPTLAFMGRRCPDAEAFLIGSAAAATGFNPFGNERGKVGIFGITSSQHRAVWDQWLAHDPEIASAVRGLASQRAFLVDPDRELGYNPAYALAVFYHLTLMSGERFPAATDTIAQAQLWSRLNNGGLSAVQRYQQASGELTSAPPQFIPSMAATTD